MHAIIGVSVLLVIASIAVSVVYFVINNVFGSLPSVEYIIGLGATGLTFAAMWPVTALSVKRLHDRNHSALWLLWGLLPLIGAIVLLIQLGFLAGDRQSNRYGEPY